MAGFDYLTRPAPGSADPFRKRLLEEKQEAQRAYVQALRDGVDAEGQGQGWAALAEKQARATLAEAWHTTRDAKPYLRDFAPGAPVPGLTLFGLGKVGGQDLNFSSDIDLMAFYDPQVLPIPESAGRTHICAQVLRTFIRLIDGHTSGRFAWRTDWRLRPDPSVTDLAMSTPAGLDYFHFQSAPWRRLALVKARPLAGDTAVGSSFLSGLHSFIWRRHLDFSMIEEIAHLKQRIHLEHPDLADQRRLSHDLSIQDAFHLKLGRGGIRDIEFIANALQLLWGGRERRLQTTHTQTALRALGNLGHLDQAAELLTAYSAFRRLENAVQAYGDRHEHCLPTQEREQDWLAQVWRAPYAQILEEVGAYRALVSQEFETLFGDVAPALLVSAPNLELAAYLGLSERQAGTLAPLLEILAIASKGDRQAPQKFAQWFRRLQGLPSYLTALQDNPEMAELACRGLVQSPLVARLIEQTPLAIDCLFAHGKLITQMQANQLIARGQIMVQAAGDWEGQLAAARTWVNESLYLSYLSLLSGHLGPDSAMDVLTELAEGALDLCAQITAQHLGLGRLPFTILAMGRLGLSRMAPGSDLDLIFVLDAGVALEDGNRAVSAFMTAVNARLSEGRVYEIDPRLRPSGASGPPTLTYATYAEHQTHRAKTWEHLALTFMRPVPGIWHGSAQAQAELLDLRKTLLTLPRDLTQWHKDCQCMLGRLFDQRIDQPDQAPGEVKLAAGGLMELEYLSAALILKDPSLASHAQALANLGLDQAYTVQSRALIWQRLLGQKWQDAQPELACEFKETQSQVRAQTLAMLGEPSAYPNPADYEETAVNLLNR